jgi:bifunctional non-homologous end joining protein LigD
MPYPIIPPMLASSGAVPGNPSAWSWEVKWDGWRALVYVGEGIKVRTRTGREVSDSLPELAGLVDALNGRTAVLDGELIACAGGRPDFYALTPRMAQTGRHARWASVQVPVTLVAFDLLHLN